MWLGRVFNWSSRVFNWSSREFNWSSGRVVDYSYLFRILPFRRLSTNQREVTMVTWLWGSKYGLLGEVPHVTADARVIHEKRLLFPQLLCPATS
jgi:hypothetical protein